MSVRQYIGARYVPKFSDVNGGVWDNTNAYDPLTIVKYGNDFYTSAKSVPVGVAITNTEYWVLTGNYNGAIADLGDRIDVITDTIGFPENYGAYGDDTHDDTYALQDCIDNHKYVILRNVYKFTSLNIPSDRIITGGTLNSATWRAITIDNKDNILFDRVNFNFTYNEERTTTYGAVSILNTCDNITFKNCKIYTTVNRTFFVENSTNFFFTDNIVSHDATVLYLKDGEGVINGNILYQYGRKGTNSDHSVDVEIYDTSKILKIDIAHNTIYDIMCAVQVTHFGDDINADASGIAIHDNIIDDKSSDGSAVKFDGVKNGSFVDNEIVDCYIFVSTAGTSGCTGNTLIKGNKVNNVRLVMYHGLSTRASDTRYTYGDIVFEDNDIMLDNVQVAFNSDGFQTRPADRRIRFFMINNRIRNFSDMLLSANTFTIKYCDLFLRDNILEPHGLSNMSCNCDGIAHPPYIL